MKSTKKLPKKLSGNQNCKLRAKEDAEIIKQSYALSFFIKRKKKEEKISDLSLETIEKKFKI